MTEPERTGPGRLDRLTGRGAVLVLLAAAAVAGFVSDGGAAQGLAVLALAAAPALFAVPPRGRIPLGLALVGAAVAVPVLAGTDRDAATWASAAALGVSGVLVTWRGRAWPALSGRYDRGAPARPSAPLASDPRDLWKALDRGEDPTGDDSGR